MVAFYIYRNFGEMYAFQKAKLEFTLLTDGLTERLRSAIEPVNQSIRSSLLAVINIVKRVNLCGIRFGPGSST